MSIKIALAGNPNCGKTTLFNALTGSNQYVGNWPGVTVENKEGRLKSDKDVIIQMSYHPEGMAEGAIITLIAVIGIVLLNIIDRRKM